MIDIVVSVYNAYDSVDKCLFFLSKHSKEASQIVLINDASTDDKIKILAKKYCKKYSWKYLENKQNLGFVKTANKGLKFSKNHTILLNSDAFVCYGWLNGFIHLLETQNDIGTATAWSNNAEIVSFPNTLKFNQPIENTNEFGGWLINNYKASYPEIPTAVGFCMLITKEAKEKVGYLDEETFGYGYGEENDFSLRVKEAGLKNVLCDQSYVVHQGNQSFKDFGLQPNNETMQRLVSKHPNYINEINHFIKTDPLKKVRNQILKVLKTNNLKLFQQLTNER